MKKEISGYIGEKENISVIINNLVNQLEGWVLKDKCSPLNIDKKVTVKIDIQCEFHE